MNINNQTRYRTTWLWGDNASKRLEEITTTAQMADSQAKTHLRTFVTTILHIKRKSAKNAIDLGPVGTAIDIAQLLPTYLKPDSDFAARVAVGVGKRRESEAIQKAQIDKDTQAIVNLVPLLDVKTLHQLVFDLMNEVPIATIRARLYTPTKYVARKETS